MRGTLAPEQSLFLRVVKDYHFDQTNHNQIELVEVDMVTDHRPVLPVSLM